MEIQAYIHSLPAAMSSRSEMKGGAFSGLQAVNQSETPAAEAVIPQGEEATAEQQWAKGAHPDRVKGEGQAPLSSKDPKGKALSKEELRLIEQLKERDAEVRAHEQAHIAAGGAYITSGPSYSYQTGPDGRRYAIGGEVGIDTSMNPDDPEGNLAKARAIIRAALAPAEPSGQDMRVAQAARNMELRAQQELRDRQIRIYETVMRAGRDLAHPLTPGRSGAGQGGEARLAAPLAQASAGFSQFA